jgi:predicted dienelactone hydrolase
VPVATGKFPVILFSHGYGAVPLQNAALETRLAAWGFILIAPDHTERDTLALVRGRASVNDLRDAHTLVSALHIVAHDPQFANHVNFHDIAAIGHSQGGGTALAALSLPEVATAVTWASTRPTMDPAVKPVMLIGADHDLEFGTAVQQGIYDRLHGPRRLVLLGSGAGHATFVDLCARVWEKHALPPTSKDEASTNGLAALATNGCHPDEIDPRAAWSAIIHFTVAQLRFAFGIDKPPRGLGINIVRAFPRIGISYRPS